ncbi:TrbG/VirB9 family P-type conjugative transfer protein [Acidiphilium sp.]|uniref:TrbG/VirB9 family P-type conjugative transfer protein n=1 Tax=Acidiphilium sp. TaxID=527 RepID=UPI002C5C73FF|nr:TrbG/VirB9 family P-type conjugative transfer protein [Acidiphilium sp.]HQT62820.1 TrbG/VirB9 family P-type conjugative transfer protein [Acidiphilium sp.]
MRRAFALVLVVGVTSMVTARGANADQTPDAGHYDSRMRYVAYNPSQVVHLSTIIGATMVVSFAPDETVTSVAETDSLHLAAVPKGNYLFLKPSAALKLQPIIVLTQRPDGALRRYVFEIETVNAPSTADGAAGVFYSVQFTYPADAAKAAAARAAADAKNVAALNRLALARTTQTAAQSAFQNEQSNPYAGPRNYKYVARGDRSLAPLAVWDNGYSTLLQFAGNARIPSIFVIDPDGKEATASYAVNGDIVQLDQTAREWRLRDGGTVLDIYNLGYQSVGGNPETGTTSPDVSRVVVPPGNSMPGAKP